MRITTMEELFVEQIKDLYDAEERLVKALPKLAEASTSPELSSAFEDHLRKTKGQIERLERVFTEVGVQPAEETCEAMKGLIKEGEEIISDIHQSTLRDAGLIAVANRVEHYEMAGYGTAREIAKALGFERAAQYLDETLLEEKEADAKLTQIAQSQVNAAAIRDSRKTKTAR